MATDDDPEPDSKEQARELRRQGLSIAQIAYALGRRAHAPVARWVADVPPPEWTKRPRAKDDLRARRESEREQVKAAARALVGPVTDRELTLVGAVLYWAEGAKDKPYARREKVSFINSDSEVIIFSSAGST